MKNIWQCIKCNAFNNSPFHKGGWGDFVEKVLKPYIFQSPSPPFQRGKINLQSITFCTPPNILVSHFYYKFLLVSILCISIPVFGQYEARLMTEIEIEEEGNVLDFAMAGGTFLPQFTSFDFDGWKKDMVIFDKVGQVTMVFINKGLYGEILYEYAPEYSKTLPEINHFLLFKDVTNDGIEDIITARGKLEAEVIFYKTVPQDSGFTFVPLPYTVDGLDTTINNNKLDLPSVADFNFDGDFDFLHFPTVENHIYYYENQSVENQKMDIDTLHFILSDKCWGDVEYALGSQLTLNACEGKSGGCAGSAMTALDPDEDGDLDVIFTSLSSEGLSFLNNGGNSDMAVVDNQDINFLNSVTFSPKLNFPMASYEDFNNDFVKDLIITPNRYGSYDGAKKQSVYWYPYSDLAENWVMNGSDFMVKDMVKAGFKSVPILFDYNNDGLQDLLIAGNTHHPVYSYTARFYLYKNEGTPEIPRFVLVDNNYQNFLQYNYKFMHPSFGDLDNDGDLDLFLGTAQGEIHYFKDVSGVDENEARFEPESLDFMGIDIGTNSAVQLVDLNEDGLLDFVIGGNYGELFYYENIGTPEVPEFTHITDTLGGVKPDQNANLQYTPYFFKENNNWRLLIGDRNGKMTLYGDISGNLEGDFSVIDENFGDVEVGYMAAATFGDLNGDGKLEMLCGNERGGLHIFEITNTNPPPFLSTETILNKPQIEIFPNPASEVLNLEAQFDSELLNKVNVQVTDIRGRVIFEDVLESNMQIFVKNWEKGVYMVQFLDENEDLVKVEKVVVN